MPTIIISISSYCNKNLTTAWNSTVPKLFHSFFFFNIYYVPTLGTGVLRWIKHASYFSEAHFLPKAKNMQINSYKQYDGNSHMPHKNTMETQMESLK